jgi:hypothetical protein
MSQASVASQIPAGCYSYTFSALVPGGAGVIASSDISTQVAYLASPISKFIPGTSQIVGCVRTTAGGTVGQPMVTYEIVPATLGGGGVVQMKCTSQNQLDSSVYTVFWTQLVAQSDVKAILPC